jgi:hypothetical protein
MTGLTHACTELQPAAGTLPGRWIHILRGALTAATVVLTLVGGAAVADAQTFPTEPPVLVFDDSFETVPDDSEPPDTNIWTRWGYDPGNASWVGRWIVRNEDHWSDQSCMEPGCWNQFVQENDAQSTRMTALLVNQSFLGGAGFDPTEWTNIRIETDLMGDGDGGAPGVVWAVQPDSDGDGWLDAAYIVYFSHLPSRSNAIDNGARARWHLGKIVGNVYTEIASDDVVLDPFDNDLLSMYYNWCYRLRVTWFCGNLRVEMQNLDCGNAPSNWFGIFEWTDPTPLPQGGAGLFSWSWSTNSPNNRFNDAEVYSWGPRCDLICDAWSDWLPDPADPGAGTWANTNAAHRDRLAFKHLFEGAFMGFRIGAAGAGKNVDPDAASPPLAGDTPPRFDSPLIGAPGLCNGWRELSDLPGPIEVPGSNLADIKKFLEPMHTAVKSINPGTHMSEIV